MFVKITFFRLNAGKLLERDEEKCVAVFRPHPALNCENRSRS
jgi:hypothetical protein